jgi:hypothetical protein
MSEFTRSLQPRRNKHKIWLYVNGAKDWAPDCQGRDHGFKSRRPRKIANDFTPLITPLHMRMTKGALFA